MEKKYDLSKMKERPAKVDPEAGRVQISLKMSANDLGALKTEAFRMGIPYQTLLNSVIHRFVKGELIDRKELEHQTRHKKSDK